MIRAYKFLTAENKSFNGKEPAWTVGETREIPADRQLEMCVTGYHACSSWYNALRYYFIYGPVAAIVDLDGKMLTDNEKICARTLKIVALKDVSKELRLFACTCAERALNIKGIQVDERSRQAIEVARRFADGRATIDELSAAAAAAAAAADAAYAAADATYAAAATYATYATYAADAAYAAARAADAAAAAADAAYAAARAAADAAAAEKQWQQNYFEEIMTSVFVGVGQ